MDQTDANVEIEIHFYSYFKELAGCSRTSESLSSNCTVGDLMDKLFARFPRLGDMRSSVLVAVGTEYQSRQYRLQAGDEVSIFPPVQGG